MVLMMQLRSSCEGEPRIPEDPKHQDESHFTKRDIETSTELTRDLNLISLSKNTTTLNEHPVSKKCNVKEFAAFSQNEHFQF